MKLRNIASKYGKKVAYVGTAASVMAGQAYAALPSDAQTKIAETEADIITAGGLLIGLAITAMGLRWVKATFF